ncbi:hypothetical protein Adi01nite_13370 [Amorphoplanes digitatis]|nr:hypothetical protein GCM10020092_047400 [Actinoplanes digitatis]GID91925.1 hypothetical protein Adi01nite_13370 [Actinoplanes digitatis]
MRDLGELQAERPGDGGAGDPQAAAAARRLEEQGGQHRATYRFRGREDRVLAGPERLSDPALMLRQAQVVASAGAPATT